MFLTMFQSDSPIREIYMYYESENTQVYVELSCPLRAWIIVKILPIWHDIDIEFLMKNEFTSVLKFSEYEIVRRKLKIAWKRFSEPTSEERTGYDIMLDAIEKCLICEEAFTFPMVSATFPKIKLS